MEEPVCAKVQWCDGTYGCLGIAWNSAWMGGRGHRAQQERSRVELYVTLRIWNFDLMEDFSAGQLHTQVMYFGGCLWMTGGGLMGHGEAAGT